MLKSSPGTYEIQDLNGEKIMGSFYEEELWLSKLWISYYSQPDSDIRDKFKVVSG